MTLGVELEVGSLGLGLEELEEHGGGKHKHLLSW